MSELPFHPNLDQLRRQAKELLAELRRERPAAKLAEAQHALARSYGLASWPRLVLACRMLDAIVGDDVRAVRDLVTRHPRLLVENARGVPSSWGPPMSFAANLGRDRIVTMLRDLGASDVQHAFDRACLQGQLETARKLHAMGARPGPDALLGPAETLNAPGLGFLLDLGAPLGGALVMLLQTYSRHPAGKHACLELLVRRGVLLPDTAPMALHRGRIDLLEAHLRRDPGLLGRTFSHREIYPRELGCDEDESLALHGTPLDGGTLLHLAVDYDEREILAWLLDAGADPDVRAAVDADGFGGHTALHGCVVTQAQLVHQDDALARTLLDRGADPNPRASLRKRLRFVDDESVHEYRDVTPRAWGERFHEPRWVSRPSLRLIAERGGRV